MKLLTTLMGVFTGNPLLIAKGLTSEKGKKGTISGAVSGLMSPTEGAEKPGEFNDLNDNSTNKSTNFMDLFSSNNSNTGEETQSPIKNISQNPISSFMSNRRNAINSVQQPTSQQDYSELYRMAELPQYAQGGIPNMGKPAYIVDAETGRPVGTMNEEAPELIVPDVGIGEVYKPTRNTTTLADEIANIAVGQGSNVKKQDITSNTMNTANTDTNLNEPTTTKNRIKFNNQATTDTQTNKMGSLADKNTIDGLSGLLPILRIIGSVADARRQTLGLGGSKGAITSAFETFDKLESNKKKSYSDMYDEWKQGTAQIDPATGKEVQSYYRTNKQTGEIETKLGNVVAPKSSGEGKVSGQLNENQILDRIMGREKSAFGERVPGWNELSDEQVETQYSAMLGTAEKFPTTKATMDRYIKQRKERTTNTKLKEQFIKDYVSKNPKAKKEDILEALDTWRRSF